MIDLCSELITNDVLGIDVHNQQIKELKKDGLIMFPNLSQLGLGYNNIEKINFGAFNGVEKITGLYLGGNNLSKIEDGALDSLYRLRKLDLTDNLLER